MNKLSYIGKIEAGKLILTAPIRKQMLADLGKYEGKRVEIIISKLPKRSIKQNAYCARLLAATLIHIILTV